MFLALFRSHGTQLLFQIFGHPVSVTPLLLKRVTLNPCSEVHGIHESAQENLFLGFQPLAIGDARISNLTELALQRFETMLK